MPFGPYKSHSHCVRVVSHRKNPPRDPHAYCKWLEEKIEGGDPSISMFAGNEEVLFALYLGETTGIMSLLTEEHALNILDNPELVKSDSRDKVVDDHRWIHAWVKTEKFPLSRSQLRSLHSIYVREFKRRGFKHNSPLKFGSSALMPVLRLLTKQHASAILKTPKLIRKDPDSAVIDDHRWIHWWAKALADKKKLFLTREQLEKLHEIYVEEFNRRGFDHQSPLEFSVVQLMSPTFKEVLKSRKAFLIDPEFIEYVGSSVSDKQAPRDVDVVFHKGGVGVWDDNYLNTMPSELRDKHSIIWSNVGPTGPYIPGYELWAIPKKDLSVKQPDYKLNPLAGFPLPTATNLDDICDLAEDTYFLEPIRGVRLAIHRDGPEVIAFDKNGDEYALPDPVIEAVGSIEDPKSFIIDGFLSKADDQPVFHMIDMPWWRGTELIQLSAETRRVFMLKLPESPHLKTSLYRFFNDRRDTVDFLRGGDCDYIVIPGSSPYTVSDEPNWSLFKVEKLELAAGSDEEIKKLVDSSEWEEMKADTRFKLMTKRKRVDVLYPFAQLKTTKKGYAEREVFGLKSVPALAKDIFKVPNKQAIEVKFDGFRIQIHKKGDEVRIFTEGGTSVEERVPGIAASVKRLHVKEAVFDAEVTPYDEELRTLGRPGAAPALAAPAFAKGAKKPVDDSLWAAHVFDLLYINEEDIHDLPYEERRQRLRGIELPVRDIPKTKGDFRNHLWENNIHWATSAEQMVKSSNQVANVRGSEGAMYKQADSKYRLGGRTPLWSKMKRTFEIDPIVVGIIKPPKLPPDVVNYICAIGPVSGIKEAESAPLETAKGKKFVKYEGKIYSVLGKTFNTKLKADLGDILRVKVANIRKIGPNVYHWFHPSVLEVREDKTTPDPLRTAETIRKAGLKRMAEPKAYFVDTRYGLESTVSSSSSSWIALAKAEGWNYFPNSEAPWVKLKEEGVESITGTSISRELLEGLIEDGMIFNCEEGATIEDIAGETSTFLEEPDLPSGIAVNISELGAFYASIRCKPVPHMKLDCGALVHLEKSMLLADPYLTYPDENETWKFVLQFHIRGLSVHADFRAEISKTQLIGWTWNLGKSLIKPMLRMVKPATLAQVGLKKQQIDSMTISEVSTKLNSTAEGKKLRKALSLKTQDLTPKQLKTMCWELWREEAEPILKDPKRKILTQRKAPEPHEWLDYEGEVPAGAVGATTELEGQFVIMDKGTIEYGAQKTYYHEYFLHGKHLNGRFFVRRLATRPKWQIKEAFAWMTFRGKPMERPYTISKRAVDRGWMPPKEISAIPKEIRQQIPEEYQYWRKSNSKKVRDDLVEAMRKRQVPIKLRSGLKFAVKRVWHKGPEVVRGVPIVRYWIIIHDGKKVLDAWDFGQSHDPTDEDRITTRRKSGRGLEDLIATTGDIPADHPASLTKRLKNHFDTSDSGSVQIIADSNNFVRSKLDGKKLKGLYVFMKEDPSGEMWIFQKSELPKPKKEMFLSSPNVIHLAASDISSKLVGELLFIGGVGIKPGEVIGMDGKPAYFTADGIKKFWPSMHRQPIVAMHGDLKGDVIGFVNKLHYDEERGWGIIDQGIIWHPMGIKLILEKKLPDFSIEVIPETIWDAEHKHDHVIGGKCIGLSAVPKGACATCNIDAAVMGQIKITPGQVFKFGLPLEEYLNQEYWKIGRSTQDLADEIGRPRSTVEMWMEKADIPRRSLEEARQLRMIRDDQVRKFGGRATITALGTGAFTDIPRDDCPQCKEARTGGKSKRNNTATLLSIGNEHLLINAPKGISGMLGLKKVKPNYVLLEHVHDDVMGGLHELRSLNPVVFATKPAWDYLRRHYKALSGEKGRFEEIYPFKRYVIKDRPFRLGPFTVKGVKVQHAKPGDPKALGFRIDMGPKVLWHCSDVYRIPNYKKVLKDVDIFIGDGASLKREIVQKRGGKTAFGHTSIEKQIRWAQEAEIPRIYFTQIGHVGKTHADLDDTLREMAPNAQALFDGAEISLGGSAPGARHPTHMAEDLLEGKRTMMVRAKPYSEYAKQAIYLLSETDVLGLYVEGYPEGPYEASKVRVEMRDEHGMADDEWQIQLGEAEKVWIYKPRIISKIDPVKGYESPKTEIPFIHNVKILPE